MASKVETRKNTKKKDMTGKQEKIKLPRHYSDGLESFTGIRNGTSNKRFILDSQFLDLQALDFFVERPYRLPDLRFGVLARDKETESCGLFRYCGVKNGLNVDATFEQRGGQANSFD